MRYTQLIVDVLINKHHDHLSDELLDKLSVRIDATNISNVNPSLQRPIDIIFFNFPWITRNEKPRGDNRNALLLQEFVESAAREQSKGGILLIGLTTNPEYCNNYKIERLINFADSEKRYPKMKHLTESITAAAGRSLSLLKDCADHGYRHQTLNPKAQNTHQRFVVNGSELHVFVKGYVQQDRFINFQL